MKELIERFAGFVGTVIGRGLKLFTRYMDDILLTAGCVMILHGLSLWNMIAMWIIGGIMLIVVSILVAKVKSNVTK